jgi:hypothetical protein
VPVMAGTRDCLALVFRMEDIDTVNFCKPETGIDRFGCNKYPFSFKVFKTLSF